MAVFALVAKCAIVLIVLVMAANAIGGQGYLIANRGLVTFGTADVLVFPVQFELGFVVVKIPVLPITRIVTILTACSQRAFMRILFFVTRPAV